MNINGWSLLNCRLQWVYKGLIPESGHGRQGVNYEYFAWLLLSGEASFKFNKEPWQHLQAGCWGFPPLYAKNREHRFSSDASLLSICFTLDWPDRRPAHPIKSFLRIKSEDAPELERKARQLAKLCGGFIDFPLGGSVRPLSLARHAQIQAAFWHWLSAWSEALYGAGIPASSIDELDPRLTRMLNCLYAIRRHLPVPYDALGADSSLGRVQIDRLFKKQLSLSPKQVLDRHLVEFCKSRLRADPHLNSKDLAEEMGFIHVSNFQAWFAKNTGQPPAHFRESFHIIPGEPN